MVGAEETELMKNDVTKSKLQLESKGFQLKEVYGDGNCLFRAVSDQIFGDEN